MAEYIDRNLIEWYGCDYEKAPDCENRECSSCSHAKGSHAQVMQIPTADVIERSKIDKVIEEIIKYRNDEQNDFCEVEVGAINGVLEIFKRSVGVDYDS